MVGFKLINDGFKKVFSGEHAWLTHISLFAICGICSVITTIFQETAKTKMTPDFGLALFGAILVFILYLYLTGYNVAFMHKSFYDEETGLPDIDEKPLIVFSKVLPLLITWIFYFIAAILLSAFVKILIIPVIILLLIISPFVSFVFVAFSKEYSAKGLFNIALPFKYFVPTLSSIVIQGLCFIPLWILAIIPAVLVVMLLNIAGVKTNSGIPAYFVAMIGAYISFIIQMLWNYSLVQIFRDKLEYKQ